MTYRVTADIEYLDGNLAGVSIPAGYSLTCPDQWHATNTTRWLQRVRDTKDFIRAAVTGNRYRIVGEITVAEEG